MHIIILETSITGLTTIKNNRTLKKMPCINITNFEFKYICDQWEGGKKTVDYMYRELVYVS